MDFLLIAKFAFSKEQTITSWYALHVLLSNLQMEHSIQRSVVHMFLHTEHTWTNFVLLPEQTLLYGIPGVSAVFIHIHSKKYSQATGQAAGLLF